MVDTEKKGEFERIILGDLLPSDAASLLVLKERMQTLSHDESSATVSEENVNHYVKILMGSNELYGISFKDILEVRSGVHITAVPGSPDYVEGVCYWYGKIVPVVNLAGYLSLPSNNPDQQNGYIAMVQAGKLEIGMTFTYPVGVDNYKADDLDRHLAGSEKFRDGYILGIHCGKTCILNIKAILIDIAAELKEFTKRGRL